MLPSHSAAGIRKIITMTLHTAAISQLVKQHMEISMDPVMQAF